MTTNDTRDIGQIPELSVNEASALASFSRTLSHDLVGSPRGLVLTYLLVTLFAYALTHMICGWFGVAPHQMGRSESLLHGLNLHGCAVLCGAIYGSVPVVVFKLSLNRFQQRYLLHYLPKISWLVPLAILVGYYFLATYRHHEHFDLWYHVWWFTSALTALAGFQWMMSKTIPQRVKRD